MRQHVLNSYFDGHKKIIYCIECQKEWPFCCGDDCEGENIDEKVDKDEKTS